MKRFILLWFLGCGAYICFCQAVEDTNYIKNEQAKKLVILRLSYQDSLNYSKPVPFDFAAYLKQPEKQQYHLYIRYIETKEELAIKKWNQYRIQPTLLPRYYPPIRTENYFFTTDFNRH